MINYNHLKGYASLSRLIWLMVISLSLLISCVPNKPFNARVPGSEDDTKLSITSSATYINAVNYTNFPLAGVCSENGALVLVQAIDVNGTVRSPNGNIICNNKVWSTGAGRELDLTTLAQGTVRIVANHSDVLGQARTVTLSTRKDTVSPFILNVSSSTGDGTYGLADVIKIEIAFSEPVYLSGSAVLLLNASAGAKGIYVSGSGTSILVFNYTVSILDSTLDLEYASTSALGGTFKDVAGNAFSTVAALPAIGGGNSLSDNQNIIIDTGAPTILSVTTTATAGQMRNQGDQIHIQVNTSEPISWNVVLGYPRIGLNVTPNQRYAVFDPSTSTSTSLNFIYTVQVEDYAARLQYVTVDSLTLNGGVLVDVGNNSLSLTLPAPTTSGLYAANIPVNARVARVVRGYISELDGTYILGQTINIFLETSRDIIVTGSPYLELQVSDGINNTARAPFVGGSGSSLLHFSYTIEEGDLSIGYSLSYIANDMVVPANGPLKFNGGTMRTDNGENLSQLLPHPTSSTAIDFLRNVDVDGDRPHLIGVYTNTATGALVGIDDLVEIIAEFDQNVVVTGVPEIYINVAPALTATYVSGSGSNQIIFRYSASDGDIVVGAQAPYLDIDTASASIFSLVGATLEDDAGNSSSDTYDGLTPTGIRSKLVTLGTTRPAIDEITTVDVGTKIIGDLVTIEITSSATPLYVTGTPSLLLNIYNNLLTSKYVECTYVHVNPLTTFTCPYTVLKGDYNNGVDHLDYLGATPLINVGDLYGNLLGSFPTPSALGSLSNPVSLQLPVTVDGKIPAITNITSPNIDGNYLENDLITIRITFDDVVIVNTVSGTPYLTLDTNPDITLCGTASYIGGSGTSILEFDYRVKAGDTTSHRTSGRLDYLNAQALVFNGSAMRDVNGNQLEIIDLQLFNPGDGVSGAGSLAVNKNMTIDAQRPTVTQVTSTIANAKYGPNSNLGLGAGIIPISLVFSEDITVIGTPALLLNTSGVVRRATFNNVANSNTLIFHYQIMSGDRIGLDPILCVTEFTDSACDLNYLSITSLDSSGGDIRDARGNSLFSVPVPVAGYLPDPETGFSLKFLKDIRIDTFSPEVVEIRPQGPTTGATQTFTVGQIVRLEMELNEEVNISSGFLGINLSNGRVATYTSGSNSKVLTFSYTVLPNDIANPLTFSATNPLTISGTHAIFDTAGNYLDYTTFDPAGTISNDAIVINGLVPHITGVTVVSTPSLISIDDGYNLLLDFTFDQNISVTGNPLLYLNVGGANAIGIAQFVQAVGDTVRFSYQVKDGDGEGLASAGQTISISSSSSLVSNNGINGTIRDVNGINYADLHIPSLGLSTLIDGTRPYVTSVVAAPSVIAPDKIYLGQTIDITVSFHEVIGPVSAVTLDLNIGATGKTINCVNHPTDNKSILCSYTVGTNDITIVGYLSYLNSNALRGDIRDLHGNLANLNLTTPFMPNTMIVDGTTAAVNVVTSDNLNGIYILNDVIEIKVDFSHDLILSSNASVQLNLVVNTVASPDTTRYIDCIQDLSDASILLCNYIVQAGDFNADLNYEATGSLVLASGTLTTIYDAQIFTASLDLPDVSLPTSLAGNKDLYVSTIPPTVVDVDAGATHQMGGSYTVGEIIPIEITFSASMQAPAGGTPTLGLNVSGLEKEITCILHATVLTKMTCNYTVTQGDWANPLEVFGVAASTFHMNGATMVDIGGNLMTNYSIAMPTTLAGRNIIIDTIAPEVTIDSPGMNTYIKASQGTNVAEPFSLSGTCTNPPDGSVEVTISISDGGSHTQALSANCAGGVWSYDVDTLDEYPDGLVVITATQSDTANNQSILVTKYYQKALALYPGEDHNFAIFKERVNGWGDNALYQLGDGTTTLRSYPKQNLSLANATQVGPGADHTCALISGLVYCFGSNQKSGSTTGQLGVNTNEPFRTALSSAVVDSTGNAINNIKQIAVGKYFSCALTTSGNVYCWGDNVYGQLGINSSDTYRLYASLLDAAILSDVEAIYAGAEHACAVQKGDLYCWGRNNQGQLGIGSSGNYQIAPMLITGLSSSKKAYLMALGRSHTCALYDGGVQCFGSNVYGQLGSGSDAVSMKTVPVVGDFVSGLGANAGVVQITAGDDHTCALLSMGVKCWGRNVEGQLGDSTNVYKNIPTDVTGFTANNKAQGVFAGGSHTCINTSGGARCFGKNNFYQLGNGISVNKNSPDYVLTMSGIRITAGDEHSCVYLKSGTYCFGNGGSGRLGQGSASNSTNPVQVLQIENGVIRGLSTGTDFSCAAYNSEARCWGNNSLGKLGVSPALSASSTPVAVQDSSSVNLAQVTDISSGSSHTCAKVGNEIMCWGQGSDGQLGDNQDISSYIPRIVLRGAANLSTVGTIHKLAAGGNYSCAIIGSTKQTYCWGNNTVNMEALYAVPIAGGNNADQISVGGNHACIIVNEGVKCWGSDSDGQLGNNSAIGDSTTPVVVDVDTSDTPLTQVVQVVAGLKHSCALQVSGAVKCWGNNDYGQLGSGNLISSPYALEVSGLTAGSEVIFLTAGSNHTCALLKTGAKCWGNNDYGQLGTSTAPDLYSDVPVSVNSIAY
ncbi:MAG: hypothetical protein A2381_12705 [Bdellovibrionales bacterium RIFOXYB1_FULL_37_110]|nr:MAG: hypothetical protein A2181_07435 [Bdellovibrionales bacterium RIFOXYA1_FULL_38_20]OFZ51541.1 MAG: hypothetical protein A2417_12390 [Bdellovibrionales bacterium RIFOXYC1_FULL_37_79]OFZ60375.1 MAG: hypothetical protein A2381_12705 [Bdellovibrionales bacterium RIFOXYB1_FULL_37_110]OFZ63865.1 MAG: hypothetical protein A2577_05620 [Bdellovibrionales bacterium RIFOXYD1_FULL_36_51]